MGFGGNGGSGSIGTSSDVVLNNPSDAQVLTYNGTLGKWQNLPAASGFADPTTTKGDLIIHGTTTTRQAIGIDGQVLTADSTQTTGAKWATPVSAPVMSVAGKTGVVSLAETDIANLTTDLAAKANTSTLAAVATSGSYTDLTSKPAIPAAQINSDWSAVSGVAQILNRPALSTVATTGSYIDLTSKPTLATVATSGSYADLTSKPTIPAAGTTAGTYAAGNDARFAGSTAGTASASLSATDATTTNSRTPNGTASGDLSGTYPGPTVAKLNGVSISGTPSANQVLTASSTSAAAWATPSAGFADPTTTKGDILVHGSSTTRLGVGSDGYALTASSGQATGLTWSAVVAAAQIDAASGVAGLDSGSKLKTAEFPDSVQAIIVESSGTYALRSTVTASATRPVVWRGPDAPTIGSGYAINDVDTWEPTA